VSTVPIVPGHGERRGATAPLAAPIHINRGMNRTYSVHLRLAGCRKWYRTGATHKSYDRAMAHLARAFAASRCKRGIVMMAADYYDPMIVAEMTRP
jgi:hypothetical protein